MMQSCQHLDYKSVRVSVIPVLFVFLPVWVVDNIYIWAAKRKIQEKRKPVSLQSPAVCLASSLFILHFDIFYNPFVSPFIFFPSLHLNAENALAYLMVSFRRFFNTSLSYNSSYIITFNVLWRAVSGWSSFNLWHTHYTQYINGEGRATFVFKMICLQL